MKVECAKELEICAFQNLKPGQTFSLIGGSKFECLMKIESNTEEISSNYVCLNTGARYRINPKEDVCVRNFVAVERK